MITVIKCDPSGRETWRYDGKVIKREDSAILIEALFNRDDRPFFGITLKRGDRFVEQYFADRWYNYYEIHDRNDDRLKAWYCNVATPAEIGETTIRYNDLALDLLVLPDGRQQVLDEDEFAALRLPETLASRAREALAEIQALFKTKFPPTGLEE
ncbi:MAG TPA: DUF402 domain-containing protein [Anaerolineaceae bacterium]|nr:DUF402 domain-containing protein [Anaerolineaceae bacterium]